MVRYSKEEIRMFAVVPKNNSIPGLTISEARSMVEKFGVTFVGMERHGGIEDQKGLASVLDELN